MFLSVCKKLTGIQVSVLSIRVHNYPAQFRLEVAKHGWRMWAWTVALPGIREGVP